MTLRNWPAVLPARQVRVARPTDQLDAVVGFYRDGLGLPELERFAGHAGYRGVLLGLPGLDHHLELTEHERGSPGPAPSNDHLLALSFDDAAQVGHVADRLARRGHPVVAPENPWWAEQGALTVEDPDGWRVVLMPAPLVSSPAPVVELYQGERAVLRPLFELAEDSASELDSYLDQGRVLVARLCGEVVGHLQLVGTERPDQAEVKNMAVREDLQGRGIGGTLLRAAHDLLAAEGTHDVRVATAATDVENLRFYQRHGFRMRSVDRDAFGPATGYPADADMDGVPLRDRVWLDRHLGPPGTQSPVASAPLDGRTAG
jgi:ribosomal protein S18 acetylase RimI-like enzyme